MTSRILVGPYNVKLELDPSQVIPDDPGAGTPALVHFRGDSGSYWCAVGEGMCGDVRLPNSAVRWLLSRKVSAEVESLFSGKRG
jgi:hypothetical protein